MTALVCEDSMEGIFSAVYQAWAGKYNRHDLKLIAGEILEYELFCEYIDVASNTVHSEKVLRTIRKQFGEGCYEIIYYCLKSHSPEKANVIYQTILYGIENHCGRQLMEHMHNPYVCQSCKLHRNVWNESHHYYGFVQFRELEGGILYGDIEPKNDVLDLLAEHFADRLPSENWMLYDVGRKYGIVHLKEKSWFIVRDIDLPEQIVQKHYSGNEIAYQRLWKQFFESIAVEERVNWELQRNNMPLRFRKHMEAFK